MAVLQRKKNHGKTGKQNIWDPVNDRQTVLQAEKRRYALETAGR